MKNLLKFPQKIFKTFFVVCFSLVLLGCDKLGSFSPSPIDQASEIIKTYLRSPSSFKKVDGEVLWTGKDKNGKNAYVVSVSYEASNAFGASLMGCMYVAYSETENNKITWSQQFGIQDYSANLAFCSKSSPIEVKKNLANTIAEINWKNSEIKDASVPQSDRGNGLNQERPAPVYSTDKSPSGSAQSNGASNSEIVIAPSFNCEKAKTRNEKLICEDNDLAAADSRMAESFRAAKLKITDSVGMDDFNKNNRQAYKDRENNCRDKECLLRWYEERTAHFNKLKN